jgi:hypothetical protein
MPMPTANYLPDVLGTTEAERLATRFIFTENPPWHPDGDADDSLPRSRRGDRPVWPYR